MGSRNEEGSFGLDPSVLISQVSKTLYPGPLGPRQGRGEQQTAKGGKHRMPLRVISRWATSNRDYHCSPTAQKCLQWKGRTGSSFVESTPLYPGFSLGIQVWLLLQGFPILSARCCKNLILWWNVCLVFQFAYLVLSTAYRKCPVWWSGYLPAAHIRPYVLFIPSLFLVHV